MSKYPKGFAKAIQKMQNDHLLRFTHGLAQYMCSIQMLSENGIDSAADCMKDLKKNAELYNIPEDMLKEFYELIVKWGEKIK